MLDRNNRGLWKKPLHQGAADYSPDCMHEEGTDLHGKVGVQVHKFTDTARVQPEYSYMAFGWSLPAKKVARYICQ